MHGIRHGLAVMVAAAFLTSVGCATTYPSPRERLLNRAAYDLDCAREWLTVTKIDEETRAVRGCGQQATYVLICDGPVDHVMRRCTWLVNTAVRASAK
jgi:hypothetical protein